MGKWWKHKENDEEGKTQKSEIECEIHNEIRTKSPNLAKDLSV